MLDDAERMQHRLTVWLVTEHHATDSWGVTGGEAVVARVARALHGAGLAAAVQWESEDLITSTCSLATGSETDHTERD